MKIVRKMKNIFETSKFADQLLRWISSRNLYKRIVLKKANSYIEKIKNNKRYNVIIETTNVCNAKCVMCPNVSMERKKGVMEEDTFNEIVKKIKRENINPLAFIMNGFGEPLVDKLLLKRISIIKNNFPQSVIKMYSNLGLANEDVIEEIVSSGLSELNVSFNGYNKSDYEKTMKIDYDRTLENLLYLIKLRNEKKSDLKIRISMALVSHNDDFIKAFIKKWEDKVDSVSVNKVHTYNDSVDDPSGKNKVDFSKTAYPCKALFNTIVFGFKGDIFLCCLDYEGKFNFGNIKDGNILDIFYSDKYNAFRKKHLDGKGKEIEMCSKCTSIYRSGLDWFLSDLY